MRINERILTVVFLMLEMSGHSALAASGVMLDGREVAPNRVIVQWKQPSGVDTDLAGAALGTKLAQLSKQLAARGGATLAGFHTIKTFAKLPGLAVLELPAAPASIALKAVPSEDGVANLKTRIAALMATGKFESVEPDYIVYANALPNDAALVDGRLWGLRNTGQSGGVAGTDIGAAAAWDTTIGSNNVVVAVIDTGIRYTHQDLTANMWRNPAEIAGNGVDDDNNGYVDDVFGINAISGSGNPFDDNNHGTHVAGTIGATANGGGPHVGVAWNVRLMALKFLPATGGGLLSDAIECIDYAISKGANIMNNSWGGGGFSTALSNAIERARVANILFVAAAGNEGSNNDVSPAYPASYSHANIVSVAAIDRRNQRASFSNFGRSSVDLAAPGVEIFSSVADSNSSYDTFNGTSMASPHVSGVAALLMARFPGIRVADVKQRLIATAVPVPSLSGLSVSGGRVNAAAALTTSADGLLEIAAQVPSLPLPAAGSTAVFATISDLAPVIGATVSARFGVLAAVALADNGVTPDAIAGDGTYSGVLNVPNGVSSARLTVTASAPGKLSATGFFDFDVAAAPANDLFAARTVLGAGATRSTGSNVNSGFEISEPRNPNVAGSHSVWWSWTAASTGVATITTAGSNFDTTLAVYAGTTLENLTMLAANDDSSGVQSSVSFNAVAGASYAVQVNGYNSATGDIVLNNPPVGSSSGVPVITDEPDDTTVLVGTPFQLDVTAQGENLTYAWLFNDTPIAGATASQFQVESATLADAGAYRVQVTNGQGTASSRSATVTVERVRAEPGNDNFDAATEISGSGRVSGANRLTSAEPGEPNHAGVSNPLASVWYRYTAPSAGTLAVNTAGSNFDTVLAAYTGDAVAQLIQVAANDDSNGGRQSAIALPVTAGGIYYLVVDGYSAAEGDITLDYSFASNDSSVPNDAFVNATAFTGVTMTGSNIGATGEIGEPNHHDSSNPLASAWWRWTAPFSGIAEFNTLGSEFDTTLALYSGTAIDALTKHASNDDFNGRASRVRLAVVAGRSYRIAVDGYAAAQGLITLNLVEVDHARPDVFTRPSADYGANVYYPDRQDISSGVKRGATRSINFHVRNNGARSDAFVLRLSAALSTRGLTTTLIGPDGNEVAAQARSGTLLTPMLAPGQTATYTLKVRASARRSEHGFRYNATLRASNSGDAPAFDQVRVSITVR